ncbi:MAG: hypothetical protein ACE5PV_14530 [Candidatus Poribacteria bacterium]
MKLHHHVFHTKHDFTPELGWAAFQLLAEIGSDGISPSDLQAVAKAVASPLTRRSSLNKLLSAMQDVGITNRNRETVCLSDAGMALGKGLGRYEEGFRAAVHCVYSWKWIWDENTRTASPSWSYREVCRQILAAGTAGVDSDDIVLRVVSAAERFNVEKVSFSRSSVSGVTMWLEAQAPPLIQKKGRRIFTLGSRAPMADSIRLHLAALCALSGGEATLDTDNIQLLAECFLIPANELFVPITDFTRESHEFLLVPGVPNQVIFNGSEDPFIEWIAKTS